MLRLFTRFSSLATLSFSFGHIKFGPFFWHDKEGIQSDPRLFALQICEHGGNFKQPWSKQSATGRNS